MELNQDYLMESLKLLYKCTYIFKRLKNGGIFFPLAGEGDF